MREQYELGTHFGKFDSLMACYLYEQVTMNGAFSDDEYSDGEGTWGNRYGRRIIEGDDRGFVYYTSFTTVDEATSKFREIAEQYEVEYDGPEKIDTAADAARY